MLSTEKSKGLEHYSVAKNESKTSFWLVADVGYIVANCTWTFECIDCKLCHFVAFFTAHNQ